MVTIGVSAHRSCADHFRLSQKYMLSPHQRAMSYNCSWWGIHFTQVGELWDDRGRRWLQGAESTTVTKAGGYPSMPRSLVLP